MDNFNGHTSRVLEGVEIDYDATLSPTKFTGAGFQLPQKPNSGKLVANVILIQQKWGDVYASELVRWLAERNFVLDPWAVVSVALMDPLNVSKEREHCQRYTAAWKCDGSVHYLQTGADLGGRQLQVNAGPEELYWSSGCRTVFVAVLKP